MSATKLDTVGGWCPIVYALAADPRYGLTGAAVYGCVWHHCQMNRGVCYASQDRIADRLNVTRKTVNKFLGQLVADGYLKDLTPGLRHHPHTYQDTGLLNVELLTIPPKAAEVSAETAYVTQGVTVGVTQGVTVGYINTENTDSIESREELAAGNGRTRSRDVSPAAKPAAGQVSPPPSSLSPELVALVHQELIEWVKDIPPEQDDWWQRLQAEYSECLRLNRLAEFRDCLEHYTRRHHHPIPQLPIILRNALPGWRYDGDVIGEEPEAVKPPKPKATRRAASHPALEAWKTVTGYTPHRAAHARLVSVLGDEPDTGKLERVYTEWVERGYNQRGIKGVLEWYEGGIPVPGKKGVRYDGGGIIDNGDGSFYV